MDDPMGFMRAARPQMPANGDIRPIATGEINGRPLDELNTNPASPTYRSKLPPPPCYQCGEDHVPGKSYGHNWQPEPVPEPERHYVHSIEPPMPPELREHIQASMRVAVYVGRGDKYVVAVETAPDWDSEQTFKVTDAEAVVMLRMVRALNIKVVDKTGGDLAALESDASQSA